MNYMNIEETKSLLQKNEKFKSMYQKVVNEVDEFFGTFHDSPDLISGWGHNGFCREDGGLIIFNPKTPHEHVCSSCGKRYDNDPIYNAVWVYAYRNLAFLSIWKSAYVYQMTGDKKYFNYVVDTANFYMDNYLKFKRHDKTGKVYEENENVEWGCGRIMAQSLNESMIIIKLVHALEILKNDLPVAFLEKVKKEFFPKVYDLMKPQVDKIHNISCWILSAIGTMGIFSNNQEMIDFCFDSKFDINKQLAKGVTKDGFWFEGSIHYNFFLLEGIMSLALFSKLYDVKFANITTVEQMLDSAYKYSFENIALPNPNDGWPNLNLKTYSHVYACAAKVFGYDSLMGDLFKNIENSPTKRNRIPLSEPYYDGETSLERLAIIGDLDATNYKKISRQSINFPNSCFARLVSDNKKVDLFMKYGHNGPSHAHLDKMNIEVMLNSETLTSDLSNCGYGVGICSKWHRISLSHNTCVVDGKNHVSFNRGYVKEFTKDHVIAVNENVYQTEIVNQLDELKESLNIDELIKYIVKNFNKTNEEANEIIKSQSNYQKVLDEKSNNEAKVDFIRDIKISENGFVDLFEVNLDKSRNTDYIFHSSFDLVTPIDGEDYKFEYNDNGYQFLENFKLLPEQDQVVLHWTKNGTKVKSIIHTKGLQMFIGKTYGNPISDLRNAIVLRSKEVNPKFKIEWIIEGE